jgi:hypothetical protein
VIARLKAFGAFWYDFVVGDDWRVALGVAVSLAVTYAVTQLASIAAWWIVPVFVVILLPASLLRAIRR